MKKVRKIRLDEDALSSLVLAGLESSGFVQDGSHIVGFEYATRTIKADGDYYRDVVGPDYQGDVEVVKWVRVLVEEPAKEKDNEAD